MHQRASRAAKTAISKVIKVVSILPTYRSIVKGYCSGHFGHTVEPSRAELSRAEPGRAEIAPSPAKQSHSRAAGVGSLPARSPERHCTASISRERRAVVEARRLDDTGQLSRLRKSPMVCTTDQSSTDSFRKVFKMFPTRKRKSFNFPGMHCGRLSPLAGWLGYLASNSLRWESAEVGCQIMQKSEAPARICGLYVRYTAMSDPSVVRNRMVRWPPVQI